MPVEYIQNTLHLYNSLGYPPYNWFHADSPPAWSPLEKPFAESRFGVVSTAGVYVKGQIAFYYKDDTSIRQIAKDTPIKDVRFSHVTEQYLGDSRKDPNTVFPLQTLTRLQKEGWLGDLAENFLSCMGGIYSQRRVGSELIPALTEALTKQKIDALLLIPL